MNNIINSELYKIRKSKAVKAMFIINLIVGMIMGLGVMFYSNKFGFDMNGYEYISNMGKVCFSFLMIFAYIIPAVIITGEFKDNTMKNALFVGTARNKLLLSKMVVMCAVCIMLVFVLIVPPLITITLYKGWGVAFTATSILSVLGTLIRIALYMFAYCCIFSLIGVVTRNVVGSIALGYGFFMLEKVLQLGSQMLKKYAWVENILLTSKEDFISIGAMKSDNFISWSIFILGVICVTVLLSTLHFKKQDIKS